MDPRSDLIPPVLALTLSLVAHGAIFCWQPPLPRPDESPPDTVELRYLPAPETGPVTPEQPSEPPSKPPPVPEPPPEPPKTASEPPAPPEARPAAKPAGPKPWIPPTPGSSAPEPPPKPGPPSVSQPGPPPVRAEAPEATPTLPNLAQLLPRKEDLEDLQGVAVPDPVAGNATEATLQLGTRDIRYRGYLGGVKSAVDLSWRWREALLAAGAPGSVVVRFTLVPRGGVDEVAIVTSSGNLILDREAVEAVRRATLPPFPENWTIGRLNLVAQFDYRFE